jgi:hypothetical protein
MQPVLSNRAIHARGETAVGGVWLCELCFHYVLGSTSRIRVPVPLRYCAHRSYHQVVTLDSNECPANPEEVAEKYIMDKLSKEQETTFEDHFVACRDNVQDRKRD